jgi:hypothetical protein
MFPPELGCPESPRLARTVERQKEFEALRDVEFRRAHTNGRPVHGPNPSNYFTDV